MKNILKTFGLLFLSGTAFVACDDYLDRQPDEQLTPDQIFLKASTTEQYLTNVYAYQPNYSDPSGQTLPWAPCADESSIAYTGRSYTQINYDTWDPSINLQRSYTYNNIYKGIREASYFMQHVYECPEIGDPDKGYMYNEARFLRAYYYSLLMSTFGPVFILGDEPTDYEQEDLNERERDSWEKCVDYVTTELYEASKGLPQEWASAKYGRATKGAALAISSRVYLYSARKLFNGNDLYKGVIDKYGNPLFPTVYDEKKWETAAKAAKDVIDMNIYGLVGADGTDPYGSLHDLYTTVGPVNTVTEMIFSRIVSAYNWGVAATPRMARSRAYGSFGPTQKLVDAFAMANGRYPITGYTNGQTQPIIDPESGYSETGFSTFTHPIFGDQLANTFMMYQNREPRFYINVLWSGCVWHSGNVNKGVVQLYTGGNSGYAATQQNYPATGYLAGKFIDHTKDTSTAGDSTSTDVWDFIDWPIIRYAEILLNYVEALNEYDPGNPDILTYLNMVRKRAGVPDIEKVYPEAVGNQKQMRELIRRERMVELCQRFPDAQGDLKRALNQAARELLLAQASDWAFIITTNTSVEYAEKRTRDHIARFNGIYAQIVENRLEPQWISELEWKDNIFQEIDSRAYMPVDRHPHAGAVYTSDDD